VGEGSTLGAVPLSFETQASPAPQDEGTVHPIALSLHSLRLAVRHGLFYKENNRLFYRTSLQNAMA
jgi:hypothetical protein